MPVQTSQKSVTETLFSSVVVTVAARGEREVSHSAEGDGVWNLCPQKSAMGLFRDCRGGWAAWRSFRDGVRLLLCCF